MLAAWLVPVSERRTHIFPQTQLLLPNRREYLLTLAPLTQHFATQQASAAHMEYICAHTHLAL